MLKAIKNLDEYYDYMYDIENLTNLNVKFKKEKSGKIIVIENLVKNNKCLEARGLIKKELLKDKNNLKINMIKTALEVYSLISADFYLSKIEKDKIKNLSPKNHALRELSQYVKKDIKTLTKMMKVEEPVARDWNKRKPSTTNEKSVNNFYIETESYIYELMAANNIVQTLYSYGIMLEKLKNLKVKNVFDYGAGAATISILLKNAGYNIIYADLKGRTFEFAEWRIRNRKLDILMIDLSKNTDVHKLNFDCIVCTEVIEHLVNPLILLKKFSDVLSKGQVLIVSESCKYTRHFSSHLESNRKYSGNEFIKIMKDLGFKQILTKPIIPQLFFEKIKNS
ncbi:MAG: methyltransferase domain-containing protein [Patescibacteria group bacterium]